MGALAIIAGKGALPERLVAACRARGEACLVLAFKGETDAAFLQTVEHAFIRHGAVGETLALMKSHGVDRVVMAGRIERPKLRDLKPDAKGAQLLARLGKAMFAGDDRLLSTIAGFFEEEGFCVIGVEEVLQDGAVPEGVLGTHTPDAQAKEDIRLGMKVAKAVGALDVGQAVLVQGGYVLGVEAIEGTDALIARCAALKQFPQGGVLVKAAKPGQDQRVDLPAIGVHTVEAMAAAGFAGIALEAGHSVMIDREATVALADRLGLFIIGVQA